MGQEADCKLRYQGRESRGKALLETDYVLFRGDFRLKLPFRDMRRIGASDGDLTIESDGGTAVFQLGSAAEKWAAKIRNPPLSPTFAIEADFTRNSGGS